MTDQLYLELREVLFANLSTALRLASITPADTPTLSDEGVKTSVRQLRERGGEESVQIAKRRTAVQMLKRYPDRGSTIEKYVSHLVPND